MGDQIKDQFANRTPLYLIIDIFIRVFFCCNLQNIHNWNFFWTTIKNEEKNPAEFVHNCISDHLNFEVK